MIQNEQLVKLYWVKKKVSLTQFENFYSKNDLYCPLVNLGRQFEISFLCVNKIPNDCELLSDEELRKTDLWRRSKFVFPYPLKEVVKS